MIPEAEGLSSSTYCREMGGLSARNFTQQCQKAGLGPQCSHGNHMRTECPPGPAWNLVRPPTLHCGRTRTNSYGTLVSGCLAPDSTPRSGRATFWPAGSFVHVPTRPAELGWGGRGTGTEAQAKPELLGGGTDGNLNSKALPGTSWAGQVEDARPRRGAWYFPTACMRMARACYRQAAGRQQAPQDGRAMLGCGGTGERKRESQDLGPSCPEEMLQRQPERT